MAAGRHLRGCLKIVRSVEKSARSKEQASRSSAERFDSDGRCSSCGTKVEGELTGAELKLRGERLFHVAEEIAIAAKGEDARLCLMALDRAHKSFETLCKVAGLLQADAGSTTIVDRRKIVYNMLASLSEEELRARLTGRPIDAVVTETNEVLCPPNATA